MHPLLTYLNLIRPLSESLIRHLFSILKTRELARKEFLLRAGNTCSQICFIERGLLRCFYDKDEKEVCSWFMKEGDVIISVHSFFSQTSGYEYIQALEPSRIHYIHYLELQDIYTRFPEFNIHGRVLTEQYYMMAEERLRSLRMQSAQERYIWLLQQFPGLARRVSKKDIASFLGITLTHLSRLRKSATSDSSHFSTNVKSLSDPLR